MDNRDVVIVGGGVAGRTASIFTARHGLNTVVIDGGRSLLERNAHLENFPGFPAGVNSRLLLDLMRDQAEQSGAAFHETMVVGVEIADDGFRIETDSGTVYGSPTVIAATKNEVDYLRDLDEIGIVDIGKEFLETDDRGRTAVDGLYAAGRIAGKPHQAIVAAGHGADVAVAVLEDIDRPFYHDWVAPTRYFTGRDRDVPPGCEEIDESERRARERRSIERMQASFDEPDPREPEQHPSVADQDS